MPRTEPIQEEATTTPARRDPAGDGDRRRHPGRRLRPEEVIETTYALADQSLRVARRFALVVTGNMRSLVTT